MSRWFDIDERFGRERLDAFDDPHIRRAINGSRELYRLDQSGDLRGFDRLHRNVTNETRWLAENYLGLDWDQVNSVAREQNRRQRNGEPELTPEEMMDLVRRPDVPRNAHLHPVLRRARGRPVYADEMEDYDDGYDAYGARLGGERRYQRRGRRRYEPEDMDGFDGYDAGPPQRCGGRGGRGGMEGIDGVRDMLGELGLGDIFSQFGGGGGRGGPQCHMQ